MCYNLGMKQTALVNTIALTPEQEEAEQLIEEWFCNLNTQIFVLCGYAGTGKTVLVQHVVKRLGLKGGESAVFVAPTGKAASVLIRAGVPASTVHSLIYTREEDIEVDENGEVIAERFLRFVKRESLPADIRLIVVDETSMVSDEVLKDLLSFGVKCLFCGDPAQLPPVNGANTLLTMPCATLTKIIRQEEDAIVRLAEAVREGRFVPYGSYGENVAVLPKRSLRAEERRALLMEADEVIVGTNRTRAQLNREIRGYLGYPQEMLLPCDGEKIVCTLNDWSKTLDERGDFHLVNGIIGRAYNVREGEDGLALIDFKPDFLETTIYDLPIDTGIFVEGRYFHRYGAKACLFENGRLVREDNFEAVRRNKVRREDAVCRFEFAYAITCHKSQGSEYGFVVVMDESRLFEEGAKWLYTAVTRAKKKLVILR